MYHDCSYSDTIQQYLGDTDPIVSEGEKNQQTLLVNHMEPSKDFVPVSYTHLTLPTKLSV